ncbi:MAG TPA: glycerol-3-phosphate 1-O-acyltransferase PlsY [Bryobacteraceae bacterium]|jgi:glycerol-3-phosphate acyltransferase PlsY
MIPFLILVLCYLIGAIPFGFLLVKLRSGDDVRSSGSGNIGATNVLRTQGRAMGVATLLLDALKGFLAVWLMSYMTSGSILWTSAAAVAVMLGHVYPIFLKFHGGKAVATFIGAFLYIAPWPLLAVLIVFVIVVAATKFISLGSIVAAACFPFGVWFIMHPESPLLLAALIAAILILYKHKANMGRLRAGSENVFRFGKPS